MTVFRLLKENLRALLVLLLFWFLLALLILKGFQEQKTLFLEKQVSTQKVAWKAVQMIHRTGIESYFHSVIESPQVLNLLREAQNPEKRRYARLKLYRLLYPYYQSWQQKGIRVLHFHTPDNHSFLRFHRPECFGDDLMADRKSVVWVNKNLTELHGFEVGRVYSGFRHVFPLMDKGEHLGSVELTQTFENMRQEMANLDSEKEYLLIHKKSTLPETASILHVPYGLSPFSDEWLEEDPFRQMPGSPPAMSPIFYQAGLMAKHFPELKKGLASGEDFAVAVRMGSQYVALNFTALRNLSGQNSAYLISYQQAAPIQGAFMKSILYLFLATGLMVLLGYAVLAWLNTKKQQTLSLSFLENINQTMSEGLYVVDIEGRITEINATALNFLGKPKEQVLGRNAREIFHKDALTDQLIDEHTLKYFADYSRFSGELKFANARGEPTWVYVSSRPLKTDGRITGKVVIFHDISQQKEHEASLRVAAAAFETQEGILITDSSGVVLRVNKAFTELTGYDAVEIVGKTPAMLNSGMQSKTFYQEMWRCLLETRSWQGEIWNRRKNGELYLEWLTITAVVDEKEQVTQYVANFSDITEQKKAQEEIVQLAFYDPLTKLPNRRLLSERLEHALLTSAKSDDYGAVIFIDLDNFKTLNDSKGHTIGDQLLIEVASRLKKCIRKVDTVARLGGDEFVILLERLGKDRDDAADAAEMVALSILKAFKENFYLDNIEHHTSPSIGVELFSGESLKAGTVLQHADVAMYQAKQQGRNTVRFFDPKMQAHIEYISCLEQDLRALVEQGFAQLQLYYQAQVDVEGQVQGAEALLRWMHPEKGMISPLEFIPLIEKNGLIIPIGHWVLKTACERLALWQQDPELSELTLAVNVSAKQLVEPNFIVELKELLAQTKIVSRLLKIELTESTVVKDVDKMIQVMKEIKALGIELSMDDFGTGYSSLSYLKSLPLSQLKIDQSFVRDIGEQQDSKVIVKTIIAMAKTLNLKVVAEGVEEACQFEFLGEEGCGLYQGYMFSKPIAITDFEAFVKKGQ